MKFVLNGEWLIPDEFEGENNLGNDAGEDV